MSGWIAENTFTLSDKDKSISVADQNNNNLTVASSGTTIKSTGNITLDAGGKLTPKAKRNIDGASAGGDVTLKGLNVANNGQVAATLREAPPQSSAPEGKPPSRGPW